MDGQRVDAPCSGWLARAGAGPSEAALRDARAAADAEGGAVGGAEDLRARLGARTGTAQRALTEILKFPKNRPHVRAFCI